MTAPGDLGGAAAPQGPLARTVRRGALLSATGAGTAQILALCQVLVVARLLGPAVVGSFAAGIVLVGLLQTAGGGGLRHAVVQRPDTDLDTVTNTAFWAGLTTGVLAAGCAAALAPVLGAFFGDPVAAHVALAVAGVQVLHALGQVPDALLQRRFEFRRRVVVDPSMVLANAVVSVAASAAGLGVWGPVLGLYAHELAFVVGVWSLVGWRPGAATPSMRVWREMTRFSSPLVLAGLVERGQQVVEGLVVGRLLGTTALGLHRYARRIGELPGRGVVDVASYVLFPAFARIVADGTRIRAGYLRALHAVWGCAVPAGGLLAVAGAPAVAVLLGPQWHEAAPAVAAMAGWGPGVALSGVSVEVLKSAGRTRVVAVLAAAGPAVVVGLLVVLVPVLGLAGAGAALSAGSLVVGGLAVASARRVVGIGRRRTAAVLAPAVVAAGVAVVATAALEYLVLRTGTRTTVPALGCLLLDAVVFAAVHLVVLRVVGNRGR